MQCTVCYEPYNIRERRPKIVPCGHTFCLQCLKSFRSSECPSCRTMFPCSPEDLIDNFLALEETADMKSMQRALWCETCSDAPQSECVQNHDVLSSRMAQVRLEGTYTVALREEKEILQAERRAHERIRFGFEDALEALNADTARSEAAAKERGATSTTLRRYSADSSAGSGGINAVKATRLNIKASEARTDAAVNKLTILDATAAQIKVKCGGAWRCFSLDTTRPESQEMHRLVLFGTYLLARLMPPCVRTAETFELSFSVGSSRGLELPDVTIEFDEKPSRDRLAEHWGKGWKVYSICKLCLESYHCSPHFTPQPPGTSERRVEKGAVCVGRNNGSYYLILCDENEMAAKFRLPLTASFMVVGRVTCNLSSLEEAVKRLRAFPKDSIQIKPKAE